MLPSRSATLRVCRQGLLCLRQLRLLDRLTKALVQRSGHCSPGPAEARALAPLNGFPACDQRQVPHRRWVQPLRQQQWLASSVPSDVTACCQSRKGLHGRRNLTTVMQYFDCP